MASASVRAASEDLQRERVRRSTELMPPAPLIAVTTSEVRPSHPVTMTPQGEPAQREMALGLKYLSALESAGAIPVVVPPLSVGALDSLLDRVSGVCLSGGPDIHPRAYGEGPHAEMGPTWPELDVFELELARAADVRGLPIFAICRGLQVLNVARGGTLHQHLPEVNGPRIQHRQVLPGAQPTHYVTLNGPSMLRGIVGSGRTMVNSFHHQAAATVGQGLAVCATAADGTVEALEATDREFVIGVQWHAECLTDKPRHFALFQAFVEAARRAEAVPVRLSPAAQAAHAA